MEIRMVFVFSVCQLPVEQKQLKFEKKPLNREPVLPGPEVMSALVKYSLQYTEAKQHDFNKNRSVIELFH